MNIYIFVSGYSGHHGYRGKRSSGYAAAECEKDTKEVCKQVPVKKEASREVEKCTRTPKEVSRRSSSCNVSSLRVWQVCEDREVMVPKITCEEEKDEEDKEKEDKDDKDKLEK